MLNSKGIFFVLSSPSGGGKTTIAKKVVEEDSKLKLSISYTTRSPREKEKDGVDYFFIDEETFIKMREKGEFLEWAEVFGAYYGTSRHFVERYLSEKKDILLKIDVQGGREIKKKYPESVLIFLLPPSFQELKRRLVDRKTETEEKIHFRLKKASQEVRDGKQYDYLIINDRLEEACHQILCIITSERLKMNRKKEVLKSWNRL